MLWKCQYSNQFNQQSMIISRLKIETKFCSTERHLFPATRIDFYSEIIMKLLVITFRAIVSATQEYASFFEATSSLSHFNSHDKS